MGGVFGRRRRGSTSRSHLTTAASCSGLIRCGWSFTTPTRGKKQFRTRAAVRETHHNVLEVTRVDVHRDGEAEPFLTRYPSRGCRSRLRWILRCGLHLRGSVYPARRGYSRDERIPPDDGRLHWTSRRSRRGRLSRALSRRCRAGLRQAKRRGARKPLSVVRRIEGSNPSPSAP